MTTTPRIETITVLVKMAQEEEGERLEALLKATKALCRHFVHKERYKAARAERKAAAAQEGNGPTIQRPDGQAEEGAA